MKRKHLFAALAFCLLGGVASLSARAELSGKGFNHFCAHSFAKDGKFAPPDFDTFARQAWNFQSAYKDNKFTSLDELAAVFTAMDVNVDGYLQADEIASYNSETESSEAKKGKKKKKKGGGGGGGSGSGSGSTTKPSDCTCNSTNDSTCCAGYHCDTATGGSCNPDGDGTHVEEFESMDGF